MAFSKTKLDWESHLSAGNLNTNSEACGIACMQLVVLRESIAWCVECMLYR